MKTFLLGINIDKALCLEKSSEIVQGFVRMPSGQIEIAPGLADTDLFICDVEFLRDASYIGPLVNSSSYIAERIKSGAVLLCFSGKFNRFSGFTNYSWLEYMGAGLSPENLQADHVEFQGDWPFIIDFKKQEKDFFHTVIFRSEPSGNFSSIGINKSGNHISAYAKLGDGHIFIIPRHKNFTEFVKYFIDNILPKVDIKFEIDSGSKEPIPEAVGKLVVEGQEIINQKIKEHQEIIDGESNKVINLQREFSELEEWKQLLWQTGTPLENIVKKFFETFGGIKLERQETDLVGMYKEKELFIEVKGNVGCINHKGDFRQIEERKNYNAKDPQNTVALLVGNPFRLYPLNERPPKDEHLFAHTSVPIAENLGIGLVCTCELYKMVNDFLKDPAIERKKEIEKMMNCAGIFKYKK